MPRINTDGHGWCFVGVDLGQARDFTAVAVVECAEVLLRLRHLERLPLGTPYPTQAERVVKITRSEAIAGRCTLVVDATGAGRPVVDLLKRERPGCLLMPVNITSGTSESRNGGYYGVPKRDLVTGMQVLLQSGGLQIAAGIPYGAELVAEMADMRAKVTTAGNTQFGAWREGAHDDLVLAVALACWAARKRYRHAPCGAAEYWKRTEQGDWERGMKEWAQGRVV